MAGPAGIPGLQQMAQVQPGAQQYAQPIAAPKQPKRPFWKRVKDTFLGTPEKFTQIPTQTPQGLEALQSLLKGGIEGINNQYQGFEPLAQQAQEQFTTQTIPGLAERFTSLGSGGSQRSSAFTGSNVSAAQGLSRQLAAMKSQYGIENKRQLLSQLQLGLSPQFETRHEPAQPGFLRNFASSLAGPALSGFVGSQGQEAGQTLGGKSYGGNSGQQGQGNTAAELIKKLLPLLL